MGNDWQRNDGKSLEQLVRAIERELLPSELSVAMNCPAFDEGGHLVAEFDILISGPLGSSSIRWLIECRDRPSQGAAPTSWIEQLVGRRSRFKFDKVIAVSTTGFARDAVPFAEKEGIVLRTVDHIMDLETDFNVRTFIWTDDGIKVFSDFGYREDGDDAIRMGDVDVTSIRFSGGHEFRPLYDVVCDWVEREVIPKIDRNSPIIVVSQHQYRCIDCADAIIADQFVRITDLVALVEVTAQAIRGEVLLARRYKEGDREIGQIGEVKVPGPDGPFVCEVTVAKHADRRVDVTVSIPDGCSYDKTKFELLP